MNPRHGHARRRRAGRIALTCAVALLLSAGTAVGTVYYDLSSRINSIDADSLIPPESDEPDDPEDETTPPKPSDSLTLLLIGSDGRQGDNGEAIGDDDTDSVLADTNIVVHIPQERDRIDLVSIPRDTMLNIPDCQTDDGDIIPGRFGQFNSAFANAYDVSDDMTTAVACDVHTVQSTTDLDLDGFVLVEMAGFIDVVDAIGGVDIDIPHDMFSRQANLDLQAGPQHLDGTDSLAFARARKGTGLGDGSDLGRIERQQYLLTTVFDNLRSKNVLSDGRQLYRFVSSSLDALTVSPDLASVSDLVDLAMSLQDIDTEDINAVTAPVAAYQPDPDRVQLTAEAEQVWQAIASDTEIPEEFLTEDVDEPTDDLGDADIPEGAQGAGTANN